MEIPPYLKELAKHQGYAEIDRVKIRRWKIIAIIGWLLFFLMAGLRIAKAEVNMDIIAQIESNNNPKAVSSEGAIGTYQITYVVLQEYNTMMDVRYTSRDLFNPEINKEIAYWYMKVRIPQMLRHFKIYPSIKKLDLYLIACYNWGIGNVYGWHKSGADFNKLPKETRRYYESYVKAKSNKF